MQQKPHLTPRQARWLAAWLVLVQFGFGLMVTFITGSYIAWGYLIPFSIASAAWVLTERGRLEDHT